MMVSRINPLWINIIYQSIPEISFLRLKHVQPVCSTMYQLDAMKSYSTVSSQEFHGHMSSPGSKKGLRLQSTKVITRYHIYSTIRIYKDHQRSIFSWGKLAAALIPTNEKEVSFGATYTSTRHINQKTIGWGVSEKLGHYPSSPINIFV